MGKRLIVCCDGTWDTADQPSKTNVTKVALAIPRKDSTGVDQRVSYHSGVGTRRWEHLRGGAFGLGLSHNVFSAYRFLVDNYEPGDELYLFGFSRGAFTARSLAGLVRNCGVLRRENTDRIKGAWALYRSRVEKPSGVASTLFRRAYAHEPRIHFIGVWDTVGALGIPIPSPRWLKPVVDLVNHRWAFHDTDLSTWVDGAFQALAIDEQRGSFHPTLWHQQPSPGRSQELKQVWFAGVHSDIGGGYTDTSLSDITLLWMVNQAQGYGLEFDAEALSEAGPHEMTPDESVDFKVKPSIMGDVHDSRKGLYLLSPPLHRPIGKAADDHGLLDRREYLAEPADIRYGEKPDYRPLELVNYLTHREQLHVEPVLLPPSAYR